MGRVESNPEASVPTEGCSNRSFSCDRVLQNMAINGFMQNSKRLTNKSMLFIGVVWPKCKSVLLGELGCFVHKSVNTGVHT